MSTPHRATIFALTTLLAVPLDLPAQPAGETVTCRERTVAAERFTVCEFSRAALASLEIAAAPGPASRSWTIARLDSALRASGRRLVMATNAGLFGPDGRPMGLLVSGGRTVAPLDTSPPPRSPAGGSPCDIGNFYCPPNGVFYVRGDKAAIERTENFRRKANELSTIRIATQSGPMLVEGGELAREFPASWRRRIPRNAACVRADGNAALVLGQQQTHATFAAALRDSMGCRDALFLDGSISALYSGGCLPRQDADYGAILYVAVPLTKDDAPACHATGRLIESEPYADVTVRVGPAWTEGESAGMGFVAQAGMPLTLGRLGVTASRTSSRGQAPEDSDYDRLTALAIDWSIDVPAVGRIMLHPGVRAGAMFARVAATPEGAAGSERFLMAGGTLAVDVPVARGLSLAGEGALLVAAPNGPRLGSLTAFVSYTAGMPRRFRRALR